MLIGNSIKHFRRKLGFTQSELAEKAGITQTHLSQVESGKKNAHTPTIKSLCESLGVPESLLYAYAIDTEGITESKRPSFDIIKHSIKGLVDELIDDMVKQKQK